MTTPIIPAFDAPTDWPEGHDWAPYSVLMAPTVCIWQRCGVCHSLRCLGVTAPYRCTPYAIRPTAFIPAPEFEFEDGEDDA